MSKIYAQQNELGGVSIIRILDKTAIIPTDYVEITESGLPPQKYRNIWTLKDGMVVVNDADKAKIDASNAKKAIDAKLMELPLADQLDALWSIVDALIDKKDAPPEALALLAKRKAIKDEVI
jgi:hypothetical protein